MREPQLGDGVIFTQGQSSDRMVRLRDGKGERLEFPQAGQVRIGNDVEIGANTTIDRGSLDCTEISAGVKIDNLVHIAHNVRIGENDSDRRANWHLRMAVIGRDSPLGAAGLGDHCRIEDGR